MLAGILSIVLNVVFLVVLNIPFYTDRAVMPDMGVRIWHRSPVSRLYLSDRSFLFILQILFAAVSVLTAILLIFGVKNRIVRTVWLVATIASAVMFVIIMIVTGLIHPKYA